jgi:hypothetical protein
VASLGSTLSAPTPGYLQFKAYQATIQVACKQEWRNQELIETAVEIHLEFVQELPEQPTKEGDFQREETQGSFGS